MGVGAQCRDHTPVGNVTQRVEHVEHNEGDDEQHDEQGSIHVHQTEQTSVDEHQQDGGNGTTDELPRLEATPLGVGVVDDVAQQRVDEDFCDTNHHDQAGDDANQLGGDALIDAREQRARHVDDEIGAQCVVERGLADVTERVRHARQEVPAFGTVVAISHLCFSLEVRYRSFLDLTISISPYLKLVKFITEHIAYRRVIFCELLFER